MTHFHQRLLKNHSGQGLTEYLILLVLVAVVCIGSVTTMGTTMKTKFQKVREQINGLSTDG